MLVYERGERDREQREGSLKVIVLERVCVIVYVVERE